jgi:hypothetical protein
METFVRLDLYRARYLLVLVPCVSVIIIIQDGYFKTYTLFFREIPLAVAISLCRRHNSCSRYIFPLSHTCL